MSTRAGKAGSSWRFGSGWQLLDLTPSCSPKTPPSRRDLFVTCFASEPARRPEPIPQTFDVGSNPRTGKVELSAEIVRLPLNVVRIQLCQAYTPVKSSRPRVNQLVLLGYFSRENTSLHPARWFGWAAHSYADELAQIPWTQLPWCSKLGGSSMWRGSSVYSLSVNSNSIKFIPDQWRKVHIELFSQCREEFCLIAVIVGQYFSLNTSV